MLASWVVWVGVGGKVGTWHPHAGAAAVLVVAQVAATSSQASQIGAAAVGEWAPWGFPFWQPLRATTCSWCITHPHSPIYTTGATMCVVFPFCKIGVIVMNICTPDRVIINEFLLLKCSEDRILYKKLWLAPTGIWIDVQSENERTRLPRHSLRIQSYIINM